MGGAPVVETVRPGVQFTPAAAASFRRAEAGWGRSIRVNSTYRDYWHQMSMYNNWNAYVAGRGPYPGHSRAIHPDYSIHCRGAALDTPDWTVAGFIAFMARHGWIRTAANDPTEQHHFEYQSWRDQHRNDPAPAGGGSQPFPEKKEPIMAMRIARNKDDSAKDGSRFLWGDGKEPQLISESTAGIFKDAGVPESPMERARWLWLLEWARGRARTMP